MERSNTITDQYCNDIRITHALSRLANTDPFVVSNSTDNVRLHFGLKGSYSFLYQQLNRSFEFVGGHHNIMYSNGFDIVVQPSCTELETFGIQFPKDRFIQFAQNANDQMKWFTDKILNGQNALLSDNWGSLTSRMEHVIGEINNNRFNDGLKDIFLLSKSLELLVLSAASYGSAADKNEVFIKTRSDKEKINAARDLINHSLMDLPDLERLSKETGLNVYKLKRGFKEVFKMTVFEYMTSQRLNLAFRYLVDTEKTSAEIAYEVGYKTPQHFNNAFKKQFGTTPNLVRNNPF